jgi:hypothetical protein
VNWHMAGCANRLLGMSLLTLRHSAHMYAQATSLWQTALTTAVSSALSSGQAVHNPTFSELSGCHSSRPPSRGIAPAYSRMDRFHPSLRRPAHVLRPAITSSGLPSLHYPRLLILLPAFAIRNPPESIPPLATPRHPTSSHPTHADRCGENVFNVWR